LASVQKSPRSAPDLAGAAEPDGIVVAGVPPGTNARAEGDGLGPPGNLDLAIRAYVRGKGWGHAGGVAGSLGKNLDAGRYWLEAKKPFEAAVCFRRVGALRECLQALLYVPHNHPRYREACVHTVTVAQILAAPTSTLMAFLAPFISSVPTVRAEATAMNALAESLANEGKFRLAQSLYKSVLVAVILFLVTALALNTCAAAAPLHQQLARLRHDRRRHALALRQ